MQLKLQRSQRMGGVMGGTVVFCLDAQAEYTGPEAANIDKYRLGKQVVYNSRAAKKHLDNAEARRGGGGILGYVTGLFSLMRAALSLTISIDSLGRGQHIECKDLDELLEAEDAVMEACRTLKRYLDIAATFNGSLALIDFSDGEKVHTGDGSLDLLAGPSPSLLEYRQSEPDTREFDTWQDRLENLTADEWGKYALIGTILIVLLVVLVRCV
ncbi:MAG TPA: hypothetical protein VG889_18750 [Rhizomicrobium sp.]|nr:hypothetical protein [Rhizomicrobium sp.]